jgi:hypothetical protein
MLSFIRHLFKKRDWRLQCSTPPQEERKEKEALYDKIFSIGVAGKIDLEGTSEKISERRGRLHTLVDEKQNKVA